jgi:hypothetical protein
MTTWVDNQFPRPDFHRLAMRHYGLHTPGPGDLWEFIFRPGSRGALLSGDIIQVVPDREYVSFMYSYPNHVPLPASAIERIVKAHSMNMNERKHSGYTASN